MYPPASIYYFNSPSSACLCDQQFVVGVRFSFAKYMDDEIIQLIIRVCFNFKGFEPIYTTLTHDFKLFFQVEKLNSGNCSDFFCENVQSLKGYSVKNRGSPVSRVKLNE